jgi:hypothetical protein
MAAAFHRDGVSLDDSEEESDSQQLSLQRFMADDVLFQHCREAAARAHKVSLRRPLHWNPGIARLWLALRRFLTTGREEGAAARQCLVVVRSRKSPKLLLAFFSRFLGNWLQPFQGAPSVRVHGLSSNVREAVGKLSRRGRHRSADVRTVCATRVESGRHGHRGGPGALHLHDLVHGADGAAHPERDGAPSAHSLRASGDHQCRVGDIQRRPRGTRPFCWMICSPT